MVRAACFLRAYAGAPVTRTLRPLLAPHRRASVCHPEGASGKRGALPMRRPAPLCICGSGFAESRRFVGVRVGFVCAPCLANWGGGGLSRFSVLPGGWVFCVWGGEGCRLLVCCVVVSLVRAEAPVPSVATSGCPKRSEGGCPCRSEEAHRPSSGQHSWVRYAKARRNPKVAAGNHFKKSQGYRTGQIRVTNSRKSSTSLPCSSRPVPKRVATSALSSNDK